MKKKLVLLLAVMLVLTSCGNAAVPEESGEISSEAGEVEEVVSEQSEESEEEPESEEEEESESSEESSEEIDASETEEESVEASEEAEAPEESAASRSGDADTSTASSEETAAPTPTPTPVETAEATPTPEAAQTNTPVATQTQAPAATPTPQPVHTHSWDSGIVTQAATCTAEGVKTYTCTSCGSTKTESIAKTDHNYAWKWHLEDDLGNCNYRERTVDMCSVCGYILNTYTDDIMVIHAWSQTIEGGPICTTAITRTDTCSRCGLVESRSEEPIGHQEDTWNAGGKCQYCGEHIFHNYVEGECWCGAVQEGYIEASTQETESEEQAEN